MTHRLTHLKLTQDEIAAIEGALNTQVKILNMQASAGLPKALAQLTQAKRTLARLARQKPRTWAAPHWAQQSWPCIFC